MLVYKNIFKHTQSLFDCLITFKLAELIYVYLCTLQTCKRVEFLNGAESKEIKIL